jgi:hypothetical protein
MPKCQLSLDLEGCRDQVRDAEKETGAMKLAAEHWSER